MIDRNLIQIFSVALAGVSVFVYIRLALRVPREGLYYLSAALFSMLVLIFYIGVVLRERGYFLGVSFGDLSAWLRLVELLMLAGFGLIISARRRGSNGN